MKKYRGGGLAFVLGLAMLFTSYVIVFLDAGDTAGYPVSEINEINLTTGQQQELIDHGGTIFAAAIFPGMLAGMGWVLSAAGLFMIGHGLLAGRLTQHARLLKSSGIASLAGLLIAGVISVALLVYFSVLIRDPHTGAFATSGLDSSPFTLREYVELIQWIQARAFYGFMLGMTGSITASLAVLLGIRVLSNQQDRVISANAALPSTG